MNPRTTGILLLVAAALGSFVYFYELEGEEGRLAAKEVAGRLFGGIEAADIAAISLTASDGVAVRAERSEGGWQLVLPIAGRADAGAFDAMAAALAQTQGDSPIEAAREPAVYGLDADERVVRFEAAGSEHGLRLGGKTPVGSKSYVAVSGEDAVYIVPTHRVNAYARAFDDLRDKRILVFDPDAVNRFEAGWPGGHVVLVRGDAGWELTEPLAARADSEAVSEVLARLASLRATRFVDQPPPDSESGLDQPAFSARLSGSVPGDPAGAFEVELAIGGLSDGNTLLARAGDAAVYRILSERLGDFPTRVVAYRVLQLAEFAPLDAQRVDLLFHTAAGEPVAISAERGEAGWSSQPEEFQPDKLAALVGALANLRASDIAAESVGEEELRGLQLEPANAVFKVQGAASEGAEPQDLAVVHLGRFRGSDGIVAQRPDEPTVYLLDYQLAEHLPVSYEAFENHFRAEPIAPADEPPALAVPSEEEPSAAPIPSPEPPVVDASPPDELPAD